MAYEDILKNQDELTTKTAKVLLGRFEKLDIVIPNSRNTQFGKDAVLRTQLQMSKTKKTARASTKKLKKIEYDAGGDIKTSVPSDDWAIGKITDMEPGHVQRWCDNTLRFTARKAVGLGMIQDNTMVAIDLTLIRYYGEVLQDKMLKTKPERGTSHFDAHMTTHSIGPGYDIPLSDMRMTKDDNMDILLHENIKKITRTGLRPQLYLVDRGFFSVSCITVLQQSGTKFLMPAVKNKRVKKAIEKVASGEIPAASRFAIYNDEFGAATFNLLVVKKDNCNKDVPITDQYVAFATNLPCLTKKELVETIPETYRKRWIEETAFRSIKEIMGKTCSNVLHYRIFLFNFALLLYSLWKFTKYDDMLHGSRAGGYDFTLSEFMESIQSRIKKLFFERHKFKMA